MRAFLAGQDVNYHPVAVDAAELDAWLTDARSRIPYANQLCQLNLLGSHDTARFLTLLGEDPGLMRLALVLLFTYPGVPCIYYGDEIGMTGANDPYNRACFDWEPSRWNQDLRGWVQGLAALRAAYPALRRGGYRTLIAAGDVFGFARFDARETLIVAVNRSDAELETRPLALDALPWPPQPAHHPHGCGRPQRPDGTDAPVGQVLPRAPRPGRLRLTSVARREQAGVMPGDRGVSPVPSRRSTDPPA